MKFMTGCSVLVTGAVGTVGSELMRQLLSNEGASVGEVIAIDNNESGLFFSAEKFTR